jgi:universal stress protein F
VAVDDSDHARLVLDAAIDLGRRTGARLRLLRAIGLPPDLPSNVLAMPKLELVESSLEAAKRDLEQMAQRIPPELYDGATAQVGVPWDAICSVAREHDADMIVIGSHGYRWLDRIIGTTAAKVVNHADRSVMVVRPKPAASSITGERRAS